MKGNQKPNEWKLKNENRKKCITYNTYTSHLKFSFLYSIPAIFLSTSSQKFPGLQNKIHHSEKLISLQSLVNVWIKLVLFKKDELS